MSLRAWILAVAAASFGAGAVVGLAAPELWASHEAPDHEDYVQDLASKYDLTPAQQQSLRIVLDEQDRQEFEIWKGAEWGQLPPSLQNARLVVRRRTQQRIRFVLDERQRELYDRDSRPRDGKVSGDDSAAGPEGAARPDGQQDNR